MANRPLRRFATRLVEEYQTKMLTKKILTVGVLIFLSYIHIAKSAYINTRDMQFSTGRLKR